jgi:hypothetical protein
MKNSRSEKDSETGLLVGSNGIKIEALLPFNIDQSLLGKSEI